jgi:hypothetical protein
MALERGYLGGLLCRLRLCVAVVPAAKDEGPPPVRVLPAAAPLHLAACTGRSVPKKGRLQQHGKRVMHSCVLTATLFAQLLHTHPGAHSASVTASFPMARKHAHPASPQVGDLTAEKAQA